MSDIKVSVSETHTREVNAFIDYKTLARIIADYIAKPHRINLDDQVNKFEVRFEDATEGSPGYKVGTKAHVTITCDLRTRDGPPEARVRAA